MIFITPKLRGYIGDKYYDEIVDHFHLSKKEKEWLGNIGKLSSPSVIFIRKA